MANLGTLTLDITAKTGNFTGPLSKAERETQKFSQTLAKLSADGKTSVDRLQQSFNSLNIKSGIQIDSEKQKIVAAFNHIKNSGVASADEIKRAYSAMQRELKQVDPASRSIIAGFDGIKTAAITALASISFQQVVTQLYDAGVQAQKLQNTFEAVFTKRLAGEELAFVAKEAEYLGINLLTASDAYMKLAASAKGTKLEGQATKDIFSSISSAARALNLSADDVKGTFIALGQIISKGTVQTEELKGQLGERLPGAFQIAARAMGVTTQELAKMLENGQVISDDFLPKFAAELERTFPVGEKALSGMASETERLKTAWFELKQTVMEKGGESLFTSALKGMKDLVVEADAFYSRMANALIAIREIAKNPLKPYQVPTKTLAPPNKFELEMILSGVSVDESLLKKVVSPGPPITPLFEVTQEMIELREKESKAAESQAKKAESIAKSIQEQVKALQLQNETIGWSEKNIKLYELALKGASISQLKAAGAAIDAVDAYKAEQEQIKELTEAHSKYSDLVKELRTDEEKWLDTVKERLAIMDQAGITPNAEIAGKIAASGVTNAPTFGGVAPEVAGAAGELIKIDEAENELIKWIELQLEKQEKAQEFYDTDSEMFRAAEEQKLKIWKEFNDKKKALDQSRQKTQTDMFWQAMQTEASIMHDAFSVMGDITKNFAGEQSAAYKAMFAMQKIFAAAMIIANTEIAASKAGAELGILGLPLAGIIRVSGYANAAMVAGMGLAGMAHDGMDSIPETGTWLLKKGERVTTAETSAKLDRTLEQVSKDSGSGSSGEPIINIYEDRSKAGSVESRQQDYRRIIDIWVADVMGDGRAQKAITRKFGMQPVGA